MENTSSICVKGKRKRANYKRKSADLILGVPYHTKHGSESYPGSNDNTTAAGITTSFVLCFFKELRFPL